MEEREAGREWPMSTTEDIELRVCCNTNLTDEDTPVELIELFVH